MAKLSVRPLARIKIDPLPASILRPEIIAVHADRDDAADNKFGIKKVISWHLILHMPRPMPISIYSMEDRTRFETLIRGRRLCNLPQHLKAFCRIHNGRSIQ